MSGEAWRDDPSIIWQDRDGDRLEVSDSYIGMPDDAPSRPTPADAPEVVERFARALGCVLPGGVELAPRPIKVGDTVRLGSSSETAVVLVLDGDEATLRIVPSGRPEA